MNSILFSKSILHIFQNGILKCDFTKISNFATDTLQLY
jgi:hypothetical protein